MVRFTQDDMDNAGKLDLATPGIYLAEVSECEDKTAQSGDAYFNVSFKDTETGAFLCFDTIMLEGRGRGIGVKKLMQLNAVEPGVEVTSFDLVGKRAVLKVIHQPWKNSDGTKSGVSAKPDFNEKENGFAFGYAPASMWMAGGVEAAGTNENPF